MGSGGPCSRPTLPETSLSEKLTLPSAPHHAAINQEFDTILPKLVAINMLAPLASQLDMNPGFFAVKDFELEKEPGREIDGVSLHGCKFGEATGRLDGIA
jgi:hypothetical protein